MSRPRQTTESLREILRLLLSRYRSNLRCTANVAYFAKIVWGRMNLTRRTILSPLRPWLTGHSPLRRVPAAAGDPSAKGEPGETPSDTRQEARGDRRVRPSPTTRGPRAIRAVPLAHQYIRDTALDRAAPDRGRRHGHDHAIAHNRWDRPLCRS